MRILRLAVAVATTALLGLLAPSVAQVGTLTQIPPMLSGASGTEFGASTAFNGVSVTCMHARLGCTCGMRVPNQTIAGCMRHPSAGGGRGGFRRALGQQDLRVHRLGLWRHPGTWSSHPTVTQAHVGPLGLPPLMYVAPPNPPSTSLCLLLDWTDSCKRYLPLPPLALRISTLGLLWTLTYQATSSSLVRPAPGRPSILTTSGCSLVKVRSQHAHACRRRRAWFRLCLRA